MGEAARISKRFVRVKRNKSGVTVARGTRLVGRRNKGPLANDCDVGGKPSTRDVSKAPA